MKNEHPGMAAMRGAAGAAFGAVLLSLGAAEARGEAILQVFNQSHNEIAARLPEIAEAGYTALWVPPPTKGNGGMSVGYDLNDPFDIGNSDLCGTWSTRYGVEGDLHHLIEMCHRFGLRVYFDNVMNHRSYAVPCENENTPWNVYPGMCPEDFHVEVTSEGFYRKWPNVDNWNDEWQVMFRGLSGLLDIAHETPNQNFGTPGGWHEKPSFVRHPDRPDLYDWDPDGNDIGFGEDNGLTAEDIAAHPDKYREDVGGYLCRAVRWLVDRTRVDGLRLDAVKHVPYYFFGVDGDDGSDAGYVGQVQRQFNKTRGFDDWNHRDSVFNADMPRDDAMIFGEHLGFPPPQGPYVSAGMRLVDDRLRNELNWRFSANELKGFDEENAGSELGANCGVMHAQSHDNDIVDRKPLHHAMYFMRRGLGLVYSDGNNHAATLSGSGGAFPRWAQTDFLGQWGQRQIPTLLHAHENFARDGQYPKWSQGNYVAWQRGGTPDEEGRHWETMLFQLNSSWDSYEQVHTAGDFGDAYLYDYASDMYMPHINDGNWSEAPYAYGRYFYDREDGTDEGRVKLPPNSYAIWNWKNPDPSGLYPSPYPECFVTDDDRIIAPDSRVITVMEDGKVVEPVWVTRKDGVDGDPDFNPYGVADTNATDFSYTIALPRVTKGTNVTLAIKADGSTGDMKLRLDGGMDFGNGFSNEKNGDWRDAAPGVSTDFWLGFESMKDEWFRHRTWPEKFAAADTANCHIGSAGARTYEVTVGSAPAAGEDGKAGGGPDMKVPAFAYHDPTANTPRVPVPTGRTLVATNAHAALASVNGQGGADGFGDWVESSWGGDGDGAAGWFLHGTVEDTGLTGFTNGQAWGLWAKFTEGSRPNAQVARSFSRGGAALRSAGVDVGMKYDSNIEGSFKGVEFTDASGSPVFGVQMQNSPVVTYYGAGGASGVWSENYSAGEGQEPKVFKVELARTATGYEVTGTTRDGGTFGPLAIATDADIAGFKAYMNGVTNDADTDNRQLYFDNLRYAAVETAEETEEREVQQFQTTAQGARVWLNTSAEETDLAAFLYYTTDGDSWPEGAGGVPSNTKTKALEGTWAGNAENGSWWRFEIPKADIPDGTKLRYKASCAHAGANPVWPGGPDEIAEKKNLMTLWTVPGLDFTTQQYHKHLDYTSWTTGFKDGWHLATARVFLNRNDGAPVANTFRQTFYLDLHVPEGEWMYPANEGEWVDGNEYGMVVRTDQTVDEVWYHIDDINPYNDGPGNGTTTNGTVEWAKADRVSAWSREMATNTVLPRVWRFTYKGIAAGGSNATIRVRLREVSSVPAAEWVEGQTPEELHVKELRRTVKANGPDYYMYWDWPTQANEMVQAGWNLRLKVSPNFAKDWLAEDAKGLFTLTVQPSGAEGEESKTTVAGASTNAQFEWHWPNDSELLFAMPNVYTGNEADTHDVKVTGSWESGAGTVTLVATNLVRTKGPLLPTCIVTMPPETDSDGAKWIITMEDSTAAREGGREEYETPIVVLTDAEATKLELTFKEPEGYGERITATPGSTVTNGALRLVDVTGKGSSREWTFAWWATNAGTYRFEAKVTVDNRDGKWSTDTNSTVRTATVQFRQNVGKGDESDADWDDDGIANESETAQVPLPERTAETWTQAEVFAHKSSGAFSAQCVDADGDGLPDGLEVGMRMPPEGTDAGADLNGDGWPNFIWDRDPPFYNTLDNEGKVPLVNNRDEGGDRAQQLWGSVTDPLNPDSDGDGLPDGVEDANRNGWADGDGETIGQDWIPWKDRDWPDGKMEGETWEETSAVLWDSDADGLCDGYGEDSNLNGWTDMGLKATENGPVAALTPADYEALGIGVDAHSRANSASTLEPKPWTSRAIDYKALFAAYNVTDPERGDGTKQTNGLPRLVITETDPLSKDTDHDGLPDGWESQYGLDPLNNGVYDFRNGKWTDDPTNGPKGNPDGDAYDNATECARNTNPRAWDDDGSGGGGSGGGMNIGPGAVLGRVNDTTYYTDGTDWTLDDLIALDDYNQAGDIPGDNRSDIYRIYGNEYNASRDMVAFYFRDGGAEDGKLYFRIDLDDLRTGAEAYDLNLYVAVNTGQYGEGVKTFPEDVNCNTEMGWSALTAVYDAGNGTVYRQVGDTQAYESVPGGFLGAHFDAANDFVAWAVDRKALLGDDWVGGTGTLKFQVYTTRDFTDDNGGGGDKGGLNDFMDTIGDDWLCSDAWSDWNYVANHPLYSTCVSRTGGGGAWNNRGRHVKLALVAHGNQAVEAGSTIQGLVNNGVGGGYWRPVAIHNIFTNCPLNLHVTPTLAIALQWAEAGNEKTWFSGPAVNASIKKGVASGALALLGSTYSDHIAKYFADDFNAANLKAAREVLNAFYGDGEHDVVSTNVLWTPERVADGKWLAKMSRTLGYPATIVDQSPHLREWFGLQSSLGGNAYKIQNYWIDTGSANWVNVKAFALATTANDFRYRPTDNGLNADIRHLLLRRARTAQATAIASLFYGWEDFADTAKADAYDQSLRWVANHPWIQAVTFDEALADPELTDDNNTHKADVHDPAELTSASQEWVHHASNGNYDRWFYGSDRHESLSAKTNEIRFHEYMSTPWGTSTNGVLKLSWDAVKGIRNAQVKALAEATIFASAFETGFHEEYNNDLSRWAYGDYCSPANGWYWDEELKSWQWKSMGLMSMAWRAQSRTRLAAVYSEVDAWTRATDGLTAYSKDVDLDGEDEWILRNNSVMALFEAEGGVMVGAWFKKGTNVWQMVGNFVAQPETGYETQSAGTDSTRGTAMKDIKVGDGDMAAAKYGVTSGTGKLTFKSSSVTKTVSLADASAAEFQVSYDASGKTLTVRNGLSPDLATLMTGGQGRLGETAGTNELRLVTTGGQNVVSAILRVTGGSIDGDATDQPENGGWNTVNLRNAPQVRQVDVRGTGSLAFSLAFDSEEAQHAPPKMTVTPADDQTVAVGGTVSVRVSATDWKGDALPVEATLPQGMAGQASWDAASGTLTWTVKALSGGGRTNDWSGMVAFRASDAYGEATGEANITVPWDADGNGVSDDWEWLNFRNDGKYDGTNPAQDSDNDGFPNYSEWVAGTDPHDEWKYIAWESQVIEGTNMTLVFKSVPGASYQIEETDAHGLLATNWVPRGGTIIGQGETTTWTGPRPGGESRMYRIKVPFFER